MHPLFRGAACALGLIFTGGGALASPPTLTLSQSGVDIHAGDLGDFSLGAPSLRDANGADVPLVSRTLKSANCASYKFFDDTVVDLSVDGAGQKVTVDYPQHSARARQIVFRTAVPFALRDGGRATFDGASVPFPAELQAGPGGSSIWRGEAARFQMTTKRGQVLAIQTPRDWQQLQDDRFWNGNQTFEWIFQHDLARDPGQARFSFRVQQVAEGTPAPILPSQFVDKFGQSKLVAFPGKVASEAQLKADVMSDQDYYASFKAPARDAFGGLPNSGAKLGFQKTGFFHVEKMRDAGRGELPVLVDPAGNLWFQLGLCGLGGAGDSYTFLLGRENKFDELPAKNGPFASAFIDDGTAFSFYAANWSRKFGKPWSDEEFMAQTIGRVRQLVNSSFPLL